MSNRQELLSAFAARVGAIQKVDGFQTDAGLTVFLGETPALGADDPAEAIAIVVGDDEPRYQGEQILIRLPILLVALVKAELEEPWVAIEAILADLKTAVELPDRTLGGLVRRQIERGQTRTLPREMGSTTVAAALTYWCPYLEVWGTP